MSSGIYRISIADRFYYGSSVDVNKRLRSHEYSLRRGAHPNKFMQNAWNKHQAFSAELVCTCPPEDLLSVEQTHLDQHFSTESCMNLTPTAGSPRGYKHTPEATQKMSAAMTGKRHTNDVRARISASHRGMTHTEESKMKMRKPKSSEHVDKLRGNTHGSANKGRKVTPEAVEANRKGHIGVVKSEETRQKIRDGWAKKRSEGYVSPNRGRPKPRQTATHV